MVNPVNSNISVADTHLHIVGREKLVIAHIILFYPHKGSVVVGFGEAIAFVPADIHLFPVNLQLFSTVIYPLIQPLACCFPPTRPMDKLFLVHACDL